MIYFDLIDDIGTIIFTVVIPIILVIGFTLSLEFYRRYRISKEVKDENQQFLNRETLFYNYELFQRNVNSYLKKKKRPSGFFVCFKAIDDSNVSSRLIIARANGAISNIIEEYFSKQTKYKAFYCFHKNAFYIFFDGELDYLKQIASELENRCYKVLEEKQLNAFIQPYFGVSQYLPTIPFYDNFFRSSLAMKKGQSNYEHLHFYDPEKESDNSEAMFKEVTEILDNDMLVVYYQPKYSLITNEFVSSEALMRIKTKEGKFVSPWKIVNFAEYSGLIHRIDMAILNKVCKDISLSIKRGWRTLPVSVNFSLSEFYQSSFLEDVLSVVEKYKIAPKYLQLEITESIHNANSFLAVSILKRAEEMGFSVLIDDFGVAYSNLKNVKNMPCSALKIDKSFIDDIVNDAKTKEIVKFIINLAHVNNFEAIAEGVSTKEQIDILRKLHCDTIQGYYYSKPIRFDELNKFLSNNNFEKKGERKK